MPQTDPLRTSDSQPPHRGKGKHVTRACISCRQAKHKCDGKDPCDRCRRRHKQCSYTQEQDGRSRRDECRKDSELLQDLLTAFRNTPDDRLHHLVSVMRGQGSIEDVKSRLNDELNTMQATAAGLRLLHDPVEQEWYRRHWYRREGMQISRLNDAPPYQVDCRHWTSVTNDDLLVSHLISLWLTWDKPFYNWMDQHLFLRDMHRGNTSSYYCSRLLVNAVLANACAYSDYHEARTTGSAAPVLMQAFISEARQHLEKEMEKPPTVPTVQGLGILLLTLALTGQDRLGFSMMLQVMAMAEELERSPPTTEDSVEDAQDLARSVSLACWAIHNMSSAVFVAFMKPQPMRIPKCKPPIPRNSDLWIPYPHHADPLTSHNDELFKTFCEVQVIASSLSRVLFDDTYTTSAALQEQKIVALHSQLLEILDAIPTYLTARDGATASVLLHHVWYQSLIIRMYLTFQTPEYAPSMAEQAQSICIASAIHVSEIFEIYIRAYGCETIQNTVAQPISLALLILLQTPENAIYSIHITRLFVCFRSMSRRWPMVMGIFRMVQHYAKQLKYDLPQDADRLLVGFEEDWNQRQTKKFASIYPQPAVMIRSTSENGNAKDMGRFLEQMEVSALNAA